MKTYIALFVTAFLLPLITFAPPLPVPVEYYCLHPYIAPDVDWVLPLTKGIIIVSILPSLCLLFWILFFRNKGKGLMLILPGMLLACTSNAQTTSFMAEEMTTLSVGQKLLPTGWIWATHQTKSGHGVIVFSLVNRDWAEGFAGWFYGKPVNTTTYLEGGVAFGGETDPERANNIPPLRGMAYLFADMKLDSLSDKHRLTWFLDVEYGKSGYWYLSYFNWNFSKHVGVGAHALYGVSIGPRLQFTLGHLYLYGSGGYGVETEKFGGVIGIRGVF